MKSLALAVALLVLLVACVGPGAPIPTATPNTVPTPTPNLQPTASPEADPAAELEHAIRVRHAWDLRGDRDWVMAVHADPTSVMSELGILVTLDEAAQLERDFAVEPIARLNAYGTRHAGQFGGLYLEQGTVVMLFTDDLEEHRRATEALGVGRPISILPCRFSKLELERVVQAVMPEFRSVGPEFQPISLGVDVINNVVTLEAKSDDPTLRQRLEEPYGGMLVAQIHPLPGPWHNVAEGAGWRLLFAGTHRGEEFAYSVRAALDATRWQALWDELGVGTDRPQVDFADELVVVFGHGIGTSCPDMRLDDVVINRDLRLVYSVTSDPLAPRNCTADLAGGAVFVVALGRDAVPDSFALQLRHPPICHDCLADPRLEVDLGP